MSVLRLCSVFDTKVSAFAPPFCVKSKGEAIRSFEDACMDDKLPFKLHPSDYILFYVADFDDATGVVTQVLPERLTSADEFSS